MSRIFQFSGVRMMVFPVSTKVLRPRPRLCVFIGNVYSSMRFRLASTRSKTPGIH